MPGAGVHQCVCDGAAMCCEGAWWPRHPGSRARTPLPPSQQPLPPQGAHAGGSWPEQPPIPPGRLPHDSRTAGRPAVTSAAARHLSPGKVRKWLRRPVR